MSTFEADEHLQGRGFCLLPRLGRMAANGDRTDTVPLNFVTLRLIAYGAIRVRVMAANLEGEAEWTSLLGHHALCRSCGL